MQTVATSLEEVMDQASSERDDQGMAGATAATLLSLWDEARRRELEVSRLELERPRSKSPRRFLLD